MLDEEKSEALAGRIFRPHGLAWLHHVALIEKPPTRCSFFFFPFLRHKATYFATLILSVVRFSTRCFAISQSYRSPQSQRLPSFSATKAVVPLPTKGSTIMSPFLVESRMIRSSNRGGSSFVGRCLYFACRTNGTSIQTSVRFSPLRLRALR